MRGSVSVWPSSRQLVRRRHNVGVRRTADSTRQKDAKVSIERCVIVIGSSSVPLARVSAAPCDVLGPAAFVGCLRERSGRRGEKETRQQERAVERADHGWPGA